MKIVVSDLTDFLTFDKIDQNVEAINGFVKKGNLFILATNKAMNFLAEDLSMINLNCEYYICNNGAVIFDRYFNVVYRKDIKQELVRPIFNLLADNENILETFIDTSHGYVRDTNKSANGLVARPYDINKANLLLGKITRKYPEVHGYIDDSCMNIIDSKVNKAAALDYLLNSYNYNPEDVVVSAVSATDVELAENYTCYAFKTSMEDLKDKAIKTVKDISELIAEITPKEKNIEDDFEFNLEDYL